jgi:hypothetical protein
MRDADLGTKRAADLGTKRAADFGANADLFRKAAVTAIGAMRESTDAMKLAACGAHPANPEEAWPLMIDEALR